MPSDPKLKSDLFIKNLLMCLAFFGAVAVFFLSYVFISGDAGLLAGNSFLNWDAQHYDFIRRNGYADFRVAFFPLFPLVWKLTAFSPAGISLLNGGVFIVSFAALTAALKIQADKYFFLLLSFPGLLFMFLPYSEAVFFLSASLLLAGLHKKNDLLVVSGLLLCSFARPVAYIFIPALFITEFLCAAGIREFLKKSLMYSGVVLLGLLLTLAVQYHYTGNWFAFFEAQKGWGNYFRIPQFPLTSWAGGNIVRLDGTALLIGLTAAGFSVFWVWKKVKGRIAFEKKELVFSVLYLAGISLFVLLFRGGWLFSLNRFVFSTPFFLVACYYFLPSLNLTRKYFLYVFLFLSVYWFWFASYVHIQSLLKYEALTVFLILFLLTGSRHKTISRVAFAVCLLGNIFLTVYLYHKFLGGGWVG